MSIQRRKVKVIAEIDTGERIVIKETPEFYLTNQTQFEIAKYLKETYPYIIEHAYLSMAWNALEGNKDEVFEELSSFYVYLGNGYPTEFYTPKSLRLKFEYKLEYIFTERDEPLPLNTISGTRLERSEEDLTTVHGTLPCNYKPITEGLSETKDNNKIEKPFNWPLWGTIGLFIIIGNIIATEGQSLIIFAPIAIIWGILHFLLSLNSEEWRKFSSIFEKVRTFLRESVTIVLLTILFLVGLADLPYAYYVLLRFVASGVCLYSAVKFKTEWARWIFGGLTVLYNPVLPIHLGDKDAWTVINLITIIYMWAALYFENKARKP